MALISEVNKKTGQLRHPAFPNGGSGAVTMSASSTTFYSADGLTQLKWNLGYIRNIY